MKDDDIKSLPPAGKPIISSRLPKAFSQPKHLSAKKAHDHQDLSAANEFKKVKKLLSPLKKSSPQASAFRRVINKLACFPQVSDKNASVISMNMLIQSPIKLDEMITLSILNSSCNSGTVRKSLHAPSFKLYATKEISVNTLAVRKRLLDNLRAWQKVQASARYLVEINSSFWNTPEGCVTIVMEYMTGDSLARLCEVIGAVPESLLRSVARRVLTALSYYHRKVGEHGSVNMSHILFDRDGKCKLGICLNNKSLGREDDPSHSRSPKNDILSLGCCLIAASVGCYDWVSETGDIHCCSFHAAASISELPYLKRLSPEFKAFLCRATSKENRATANELLSHAWIRSEEVVGADVTVKELIGMSVVGSKEVTVNVEKQVGWLVESIQCVLTGRNETQAPPSAAVEELAMEIGIRKGVLQEKIQEMFKAN
jgi:hypothetical protein